MGRMVARRHGVLYGSNEVWSDEETDNPLLADVRNFYKVEECCWFAIKGSPLN